MKVTIFFCLLAVYGAIAADTTTGVDVNVDVNLNADTDLSNAASAAADKGKSWINKLAPGKLIGSGLDLMDSGLKWKESLVHQSLGIANTGFEAGAQVAEQAMVGAQDMIKAGAGIGANVTNTITNVGSELTDKAFALLNTATGGHFKGVIGKVNGTAQDVVATGGNVAGFGINLSTSAALAGMDFGKSVAKNVGEKAGKVLGFIGNAESNINNKTSSIGATIGNKISNLGQGFGQWLTNSFQLNRNQQLTQ